MLFRDVYSVWSNPGDLKIVSSSLNYYLEILNVSGLCDLYSKILHRYLQFLRTLSLSPLYFSPTKAARFSRLYVHHISIFSGWANLKGKKKTPLGCGHQLPWKFLDNTSTAQLIRLVTPQNITHFSSRQTAFTPRQALPSLRALQAGMQEPWSLCPCVCPVAAEAPAAGRSRCFLVFFSRESPRRYLQWNAKHQLGTSGPTRSRIPSQQAGKRPALGCFLGRELHLGTCTQQSSAQSSPKRQFSPLSSKEKLVHHQLRSTVRLCSAEGSALK